jgi:hypothetical protein
MSDPRNMTVPGAVLTSVGIQFDPGTSFDQWHTVGSMLERMNGAVQWWIGDWLLYGENRPEWGDGYEQAISIFKLSYSTLANYKRVAKRVEFSRRRENLPFDHHEAVACLEDELQEEVLSMAEPDEEGKPPRLDRDEMRKEVKARRVGDIDSTRRETEKMMRQFEKALRMLAEAGEWLGMDIESKTIEQLRDEYEILPVS